MRTKLLAIGLLFGLALLGMSAPSAVAADDNSGPVRIGQQAVRVTPGRPTTEARQELIQARHRRGVVAEVPELSASLAAQGLCLLLGATLLIHERRRRTA
jgi:hypothetical protein